MGSTSACTAQKSLGAAYGLPYKLDMRSFGGGKASISDEFGSLSGRSKVVLADLGLAVPGSTMDANSFKIHSIISKANSMLAHANPADIKALKKPDKALPCPRCNSLDTKFCYYNNYNVNQPRHFCKGCQRYWTAGGTLRNVAIGAGRRKRKHASLESDSQDSTVDDCTSHDISPMKVSGNSESGSAKSEFAHGSSQFAKHQMFPFERIPCAALSNPQPPHVQNSSFSEYMHSKRIVSLHDKVEPLCKDTFKEQANSFIEHMHSKRIVSLHDKVEPLCNSDTLKEQANTFIEYLRPKHIAAQPDKDAAPCNSHEHACDAVFVERSKTSTFNLRTDLQHNECSDMGSKLFLTTSSEMQASNESGCASSLTTQAVSVDACVTDGKSDVMDSEVTKQGYELDKGGSYANKILQTAIISPCKAHMDGGGSATSSFGNCDSSSVATMAPTWKGPLENPAFKPAWPMVSPVLSWGPSADNAHLWGFPWGPTASAVDAAKAAMIPNTGLSQKHQTEPNRPSEMRLWVPKTLRIKDADEAARSSIWSTLGIKDRQGSVLSEKVESVLQSHSKAGGAPATQSQHVNPVAFTQSMAFQESS